MSGVTIELRDVVVARGGRRILDVGELAIEAGRFVGVLGRNGAGKSTFLQTVAGLVRPTRGAVLHDRQSITSMSRWRATSVRRSVGFVPQATEYHADLPLTVREVVGMGLAGPAGLLRSPGEEGRRRVDDWLDRLGLAGMASRTFRSLSGGEQQKVLLARAMVQAPRLLLLDEPAANLDMDWKARMVEWLERVFAEHSMTVVMVSHETGLLPSCCDRVALMDAGRIVRYGPPDETLGAGILGELYGCPVEVIEVDGRRHAVARAQMGSA
ncbi:MAG: metal ABC transporter ATP-binding protein [Phycisphaerae bacterium]|nr:metal ABC transporter ATP-binding protein [Phycisphaerae bacterium]